MPGRHSGSRSIVTEVSATPDPVTCAIDGVLTQALRGETVAGLLIRTGAPGSQRYFCGMGACYECLVLIDGRRTQACLTPVAEGMTIEGLAKETAGER